jgi:polar amino acid transport system substrate-binding protein
MSTRWILILAVPLLAACSSVPTLVIGSDLENEPFAYMDDMGVPQGRDVEMVEALGHALDRRIVWKRMPFDQLIDSVASGQVDIVCATLGVTPEREAIVNFSIPYFATELSVVVTRGPSSPNSLADLAGKRVAGGVGTTSERAIRKKLPESIGVFENKEEMSTLERLTSGEVDAVVMDAPAARALVAANADALAMLNEPLDTEHYALALNKAAGHLLEAVDRELSKFERRGSFHRWNQKFGLISN